MKVLKANNIQYDLLNGYKNDVNQLEFSKDSNDNWIISSEIKNDPAFLEVIDIINQLEEIDYSPILEQ